MCPGYDVLAATRLTLAIQRPQSARMRRRLPYSRRTWERTSGDRPSSTRCFQATCRGGELPKSQAADYFTANCDHVEEQLRKLLDEATGFAVSQTIARHIPEITQLAANLAIEFGASRAQLCLLAAKPEEHVEVGPCFHHYKDGASRKGAFLTVDLMVSPGLCKIGDGRGDMTARRVLVQSDIYPA